MCGSDKSPGYRTRSSPRQYCQSTSSTATLLALSGNLTSTTSTKLGRTRKTASPRTVLRLVPVSLHDVPEISFRSHECDHAGLGIQASRISDGQQTQPRQYPSQSTCSEESPARRGRLFSQPAGCAPERDAECDSTPSSTAPGELLQPRAEQQGPDRRGCILAETAEGVESGQ